MSRRLQKRLARMVWVELAKDACARLRMSPLGPRYPETNFGVDALYSDKARSEKAAGSLSDLLLQRGWVKDREPCRPTVDPHFVKLHHTGKVSYIDIVTDADVRVGIYIANHTPEWLSNLQTPKPSSSTPPIRTT